MRSCHPQIDLLQLLPVVRLAWENPRWGYTRIRGGLKALGRDIGRNTIKAIIRDHGIEPAPDRGATMLWKTCLAAHWDALLRQRERLRRVDLQ